MKKLLLFFYCSVVIVSTNVNASKVTDAIEAMLDNIEHAANNIDQTLDDTNSAFDSLNRGFNNFNKSVNRFFDRANQAASNIATRAQLSVDITQDYHRVDQCERAFATSAAIGLASALGGCPLAPLFCTGAQITGGLLAASYIKLFVDKAAYKRARIF